MLSIKRYYQVKQNSHFLILPYDIYVYKEEDKYHYKTFIKDIISNGSFIVLVYQDKITFKGPLFGIAEPVEKPILKDKNIQRLYCNNKLLFAVHSNILYIMGNNQNGEGGIESEDEYHKDILYDDSFFQFEHPIDDIFTTIYQSMCFVASKGKIYHFGFDFVDSKYKNVHLYKPIVDLNLGCSVQKIEFGYYHLLLLTSKKDVYVLGSNDQEMIGLDYKKFKKATKFEKLTTDVLDIQCGPKCTLLYKSHEILYYGEYKINEKVSNGKLFLILSQIYPEKILLQNYKKEIEEAHKIFINYDEKMKELKKNLKNTFDRCRSTIENQDLLGFIDECEKLIKELLENHKTNTSAIQRIIQRLENSSIVLEEIKSALTDYTHLMDPFK